MQRGLRSGPSREVPLATAWAVVFVLLLALRVVFLMAEGPPPDSRTWLQLGSLVLLLLVGVIVIAARFLPQRRVLIATAAVFVFAWAFIVLEEFILGATTGLDPTIDWTMALGTAIVDAAIALPVAAVMRLIWLRFGATDRVEW